MPGTSPPRCFTGMLGASSRAPAGHVLELDDELLSMDSRTELSRQSSAGQHLGICVMLAVATPTGYPPLVESPGIAVVNTNTTATFW